jgi:hypothetical protein
MINLNPKHITAQLITEPLHEPTIAATKVNYATASVNVLHDQFVSQPNGRIGNLISGWVWHLYS